MASFCKRKGIIYPSADIYGGIAGFFDFGPYGVEIKKNLRDHWWNTFVRSREDVVGMDGSIVTNPKVWKASGHVDSFVDLILESKEGSYQVRADHFLEDELGGDFDGVSKERVDELVKEHGLKAPNGEEFKPCFEYNLMFQTNIGPRIDADSKSYLRPETAQLIFANFRLVQENGRMKVPFGIAQVGKAFRNEISPRNFLFRGREFEQCEIEYFIKDGDLSCPYLKEVEDEEIRVLSAKTQEAGKEGTVLTMKECVSEGLMLEWHAYFLGLSIRWFGELGCDINNFRAREHLNDELAHYSSACWDLEYEFPFGFSEIQGIADRTTYDLEKHMKHSGKKMTLYDDKAQEKFLPRVIAEPSLGLDRAFLVLLYEAYNDDKERGNVVLNLSKKLSPHKIAVFPLVKNKDPVKNLARDVYFGLKNRFVTFYDESGSIGKRYARQDEIGTPYCVTVDFDSLDDGKVTVRDRDSTEQDRVSISDLDDYFFDKLR